jgi:hypothetical protein
MANTTTYVGRKSDGVSYALWYQAYDQKILASLGMHADELPDIFSEADAYHTDDSTPIKAAKTCIGLHIGTGDAADDDNDDLSGSWY